MPSQVDDGVVADSRLQQVLADYLQAVEGGRPTNRQRLLAEHPELAGELQAFFNDRDFMKRCAGQIRFVVPTYLGEYQLLEEIGSGAFGVVVKARLRTAPEIVAAIKLFRGKQGSARAEARKAALLDHPNIVPVQYVGEHEGRAYYVMRYIDGKNLAQHLKGAAKPEHASAKPGWLARVGSWLAGRPTEEQHRQRWASELVAKIARAVHHAHQRGVIHRDLKPGNILLDAAGEPHITDFDLAKLVEEDRWHFELGPVEESPGIVGSMVLEDGFVPDTALTEQGVIVGTANYMSPEQAAGQELTTTSDVYSLGVVLFEMLTGQVPIRGNSPTETLQRIQKEKVPAPRSLNPGVDPRLERVCLKCLQRNPQERYGSALGLARNLERWLGDEPLIDPPDPFSVRCRLWSKRNPGLASLLVTAAMLLVFVLVMAISLARARAARLEDEVLKSNAFAAQGVASTVLWHLERLSDPVLETGGDPELRRLLEENFPDRKALQALAQKAHRQYADPAKGLVKPGEEPAYQDWYVLDTAGRMLACATHVPGDEPYRWRDYFDGAMRKGRAGKTGKDSIHVSKTYRGDRTKMYLFAISAPVYSSHEPARVVGVVAVTITTRPTWSQLQISDGLRTSVLVGPEDPNPPHSPAGNDGPPPEREAKRFLVVLHPAYNLRDQAEVVTSDKSRLIHQPVPGSVFQLPEPEHDFRPAIDRFYDDPFADRGYAGRWLAGFAPVGNTGYVVVVQQRYDDAIQSPSDIVWTAAAILLGLLFTVTIGKLGYQWFLHRSQMNEPQPERAPKAGLVRHR